MIGFLQNILTIKIVKFIFLNNGLMPVLHMLWFLAFCRSWPPYKNCLDIVDPLTNFLRIPFFYISCYHKQNYNNHFVLKIT